MANANFLQEIGTVTKFYKNQVIFMQNDPGNNMYIVLKGTFGVYINSFSDFPVRISEISQGSFFGEMSVIDGWPRSATIIAEEDGTALAIDKSNFGDMIENRPDIAEGILETLRKRTKTMAESLRRIGKTPPMIGHLIRTEQVKNIRNSTSIMKGLAKRLREMNDIISMNEIVPPNDDFCGEDNQGSIKLLPEGYTPFEIEDKNDNYRLINARSGVCPFCRKKITVFVPAYSCLVQKSSTLDQRFEYTNLNILWYSNTICPNCNYTNSYQEFIGSLKPLEEPCYTGNQFENDEGFCGFVMPRSHTLDEVMLSYYLRIACIERTTNTPLALAKAWVRLYWLYSDYDRPKLMLQAAKRTQYYYLSHIKKDNKNILDDNKLRIYALLGEIAMNIGNVSRARDYFEKASAISQNLSDPLANQCIARYNEIQALCQDGSS